MPTGENKSLQLSYKAEWYGRELIKIDRWFPSSKRCSSCGHIVEKMPLTVRLRSPSTLSGVEGLNVREWECPKCKTHHDRDLNASLNILAAGLAVSACGATIRAEQSKSVKPGALAEPAPVAHKTLLERERNTEPK